MCTPMMSRYAGVLLSLLLVMLVMPSPGATATGSRQQASPPQRLRLKVRENTVRVGGETTFTVEFLDRNYGQVHNDQTRKIKLWQEPVTKAKGSGEIRPEEIIVKPGDWASADITFASKQPGRLLLKASSEGLEEAQALVVIAGGQRASILSDLLEWIEPTAAAAGDRLEFLIMNSKAPANARSPVKFNLLLSSEAHEPLSVRLRAPGAYVQYNGETRFGFANIRIDKGKATSDEIELTSDRSGKVQIQASVEPDGLTEEATAEFVRPSPQSIYLDDMPPTISSYQREVPFTVKLADQDKVPASSDSEQLISLSSPDNPEIVEFENQGTLKMLANQEFIRTTLHLKQLPANAEISLLAKDKSGSLRPDFKSFKLESPVHKLSLNGPIEVNRGGQEANLTITLTDVNGTPQPADWERRIYLTADAGQVTPSEVVIPQGQGRVSVKYLSPNQVGKYNLRADSHGIAQVTLLMNVVTPAYLLVIFAVFGALTGGAVQHVRNGTLTRIKPRWTGKCWELGLSGYIFGSTVSGLILYLVFRLGLSSALGSPALPAGLNMGTKTVAFFFGVIGGFAGVAVLRRLVSWCLPKHDQQEDDEEVAKATAVTT